MPINPVLFGFLDIVFSVRFFPLTTRCMSLHFRYFTWVISRRSCSVHLVFKNQAPDTPLVYNSLNSEVDFRSGFRNSGPQMVVDNFVRLRVQPLLQVAKDLQLQII